MTVAVMIEWEASNVSYSEILTNDLLDGSLCASIVNPDVNNTQRSVQIQVVSENFTAQGNANVLLLSVHYSNYYYLLSIAATEDFIPISEILTFKLVTSNTQCVNISILNDLIIESDEEFFLQTIDTNLTETTPQTVAITIIDDDGEFIARASMY